jgi:mono/diheme cytochrome c family protein
MSAAIIMALAGTATARGVDPPGLEHAAANPTTLILAPVQAGLGGVFSDDPAAPAITVEIPPGALTADAVLRVRAVKRPPGPGPDQAVTSPAFDVRLQGRGDGKVGLAAPMKVVLTAERAPDPGEVPEVATRQGHRWNRLGASFYRPSTVRAVGLTRDTGATYRAVYRSLKVATGPGVERGRVVFMDETFGNEDFFGAVLGLHELLNGVPPVAAVGLGVQVDITQVPQPIVDVLTGDDDGATLAVLENPEVTRALIKADAVIGVKGFYSDPASDVMTSAGITCALCHVTVTPSDFGPPLGVLPIGEPRFDGVPNNAMDAGAILALTPTIQSAFPALVPVLNGWGPGRFDVRALDVPNVDRNPLEDGIDNPTTYPPLWNFLDLSAQAYRIGWDGLFLDNGVTNNALGSISEAVYDLIFHGNGAFGYPPFVIDGGDGGTLPPELSIEPPPELVAGLVQSEIERPGNDIVPPEKLLDVQAFMRSIARPPPGPFDESAAEMGFELFHGKANCVACHQTADLTGPGLFTDITAMPPQGGLAAGIKVPGLRGIATTAPYFHDGSAATLAEVVARFVQRGVEVPPLAPDEQAALVEYLKSL